MKQIVKKYTQILTNKNYAFNTIKTYSHYLQEFLKQTGTNPYHITTKQIVNFLENKQFTSTAKQNQYIGALKLFAKYILGKKDIHLSKIERPRKNRQLPKVIDKEHLLKTILSIENLKHKAILALAYSTGMRVSEIINLKIADIDSNRMLILIRQAKGKKDRYVPLSENLLQILRNYYKQYKPKEYLFNGQFSNRYSATSCNKIIKKYIGTDAHMHLLRHSCFTHLLENGTDIRIIQKIAGHKSSKTTEIYTHVSNNLLQQIAMPI